MWNEAHDGKGKKFYNIRFMHKTMIIIISSYIVILASSSFTHFTIEIFLMPRTHSGHESRVYRVLVIGRNSGFRSHSSIEIFQDFILV